MIFLKNTYDLINFFQFPFFFNSPDGQLINQIKISISDFINNTIYSETVTLTQWSNNQPVSLSVTFNDVMTKYIDNDSKIRLNTMIESVVNNSSIYDDSAHVLTISFINSSQSNLSISKIFFLPSIASSANNSVIMMNTELTNTTINGVAELYLNETNLIGLTTYFYATCTFGDTLIYTAPYSNTQGYIKQSINIANYEMNQLIFFAVGKFSDNTTKFIGYNTLDQMTILTPNITVVKGNIIVDSNNTKEVNVGIQTQCNVWNGIRYVDYGNKFIRDGISLNVNGVNNSQILVNRLIGV